MEVGRIEAVKISKKQAVKYAATAAYDYCGKEIKKVKYLGGGSFGRAVLVSFKDGAKIVIKLLRAKNMLEKEVHDCALLAQKCPVKMPSVLFSRKRDAKIPLDLYFSCAKLTQKSTAQAVTASRSWRFTGCGTRSTVISNRECW